MLKKESVKVSVIIPTREIGSFLIDENLPALDKQPFRNFECIVLPNQKSRQDSSLQKKYQWLRIIPTPSISRPAQKRDVGAKAAKGHILAFIDDDAYASTHWLKQALHLFEKTGVEAICGPGILPHTATFWERVFDEVLKTWIGSGGLAYRFVKGKKRAVDDYPSMNFLIKKDVFKSLGGFNNNYWPGEDSKLCEDLVNKRDGKIIYDPSVYIYHHRRRDLIEYLRQHGNYGFHRGAFFAHGDKNSQRVTYLIPTLFALYLVFFLVIILIFNFFFSLPLFFYLFLTLFVFCSAFKNTRSLKIALFSSIVLFLMHVVYGVQFIKGFFVGLTKKEKIYGH